MPDDFCIEHGYEHMRSQMGNPIPYCAACDSRNERRAEIERILFELCYTGEPGEREAIKAATDKILAASTREG